LSNCFDVNYLGATAGCFQSQCQYSSTSGAYTLVIQVSSNVYSCPAAGGDITIGSGLSSFTLTCPDVNFFCSTAVQTGNSTTPWTFNPGNGVPFPNPFLPPGSPGSIDFSVGSTAFIAVIVVGCALALIVLCVIIYCCCCQNGGQ